MIQLPNTYKKKNDRYYFARLYLFETTGKKKKNINKIYRYKYLREVLNYLLIKKTEGRGPVTKHLCLIDLSRVLSNHRNVSVYDAIQTPDYIGLTYSLHLGPEYRTSLVLKW